MRIAVFGAGGVGGFYGARLAQAGQDVTFIARGAHLAAMQRDGLRLEGDVASVTLPRVAATDDPAGVGPVELVLFTTKAYDLEGAARQMQPLLGAQTVVLPLLNGFDIAERLGGVVGAPHVLGGLCQLSARIAAPGLIRQMGPLQKIVFGELSGERTPRAQAVQDVLKGAGIDAELSTSIRGDIWRKFMFIAAAGGVCSVTASLIGPVLADPDTRALYLGCLEEIAALAVKQGVPLPPTAPQEILLWSDSLPPQTRPSMLLSLQQGQPLEVDALNGAAARLGGELGVPTPINAFIHTALKLRAAGQPA